MFLETLLFPPTCFEVPGGSSRAILGLVMAGLLGVVWFLLKKIGSDSAKEKNTRTSRKNVQGISSVGNWCQARCRSSSFEIELSISSRIFSRPFSGGSVAKARRTSHVWPSSVKMLHQSFFESAISGNAVAMLQTEDLVEC